MEASVHMSAPRRLGLTLLLIAIVALTAGLQFASCTALGRWQRFIEVVMKNDRYQIAALAHAGSDSSFVDNYKMIREMETKIAAMPFVQATSVTLEIPMEHDCISRCDNIFAVDPQLDISIRPWFEGDSKAHLGPHDIWVGAYTDLKMGDTVPVADEIFRVAGVIDKGADFGCYFRLDSLYDLAEESDGEWEKKCRGVHHWLAWLMIKLRPPEEAGIAGDKALKVLEGIYPDITFVHDTHTPAPNKWTPHFFALVIAIRVFSLLLWPVMLLCLVAVLTRLKLAYPSETVGRKIWRSTFIALLGAALGIDVCEWLTDLVPRKVFHIYNLRSAIESHFGLFYAFIFILLALILSLASIPISDRFSRRSGDGEGAEG